MCRSWVVVVHIDGYFEVHAVDGVHQCLKARQVHGYGEIHRDAQLVADDLRQLLRTAGAEGGVDLVAFAVPDGLGVPGDADAVDVAVGGIHRHQDVGVAVAVAVVAPGEQDGVEVGLALQMGGPGLGLRVLDGLLIGDRLRLVGLGGVRRDLRGTEEAEVACVQGGGHEDHEKQQPAPAAPSPAGSLCHVTIRSLPPRHHRRRRFPQMIYIMLVHYKTHRRKTQEENGVPRTGTPFFRTVRSPPARPPAPAAAAAS